MTQDIDINDNIIQDNSDDIYYKAELEIVKEDDDFFPYIIKGNIEKDAELVTMSNGLLIIKTVYADKKGFVWDLYERRDEWQEIDHLVEIFQKKQDNNASRDDIEIADKAGQILIEKFYPLFKKYLIVLTTGQINFKNAEQKLFVKLFVDTPILKNSLHQKKLRRSIKEAVTKKFNFITESYGKQNEVEIIADLHMLFFILVNRYKPMGKSFCCYLYNTFKFEVARHIKNYLKNPCHFHYKTLELDENEPMEEKGYDEIGKTTNETNIGIPDLSWIHGQTCSDIFKIFTPLERKIFVKYYIENWNDAQIAELLGVHINTANQRRKNIVKRLADEIGFDLSDIKRHRKSGRHSIREDGAA